MWSEVFPLREKDERRKLIALLRDFAYDLLSQILPFYSTEDERYFGFNAAFCGRRGAGDVD